VRLNRDQARIVLILLVLCAIVGLGLLRPWQAKFSRLQKSIDTTQRQLGSDRENAAGLAQVAQKVKKLQ